MGEPSVEALGRMQDRHGLLFPGLEARPHQGQSPSIRYSRLQVPFVETCGSG